MHIPDGYLSPATCAVTAGLASPACFFAARRLKGRLREREAPLLAAGSAFAFGVMMLNVPVPGGTTAHAVGGTLLAIVLGPEAAILALVVTLVIQALFFGDGGVLALGANILNMAVILPISGHAVYRILSGMPGGRPPRPWAAAIGAYAGINLAAIAAAVELGIQPVLYHTAAGTPLYCPYRLGQTLPAMLLAHLTLAGAAEAAVSGMAVAFLLRTDPVLLNSAEQRDSSGSQAWIGVGLLVALAPLGLLASGSAFGEYSTEDLKKIWGFIPPGMNRLAGLWRSAPLPGYGFPHATGGWQHAAGYWISAMIGVAAAGALCCLLARALRRRDPVAATQIRAGQPAPEQVESSVMAGHVPAWLLQMEPGPPCAPGGTLRRTSFLEKTLTDTAALARQMLFSDSLSRQPGLLQKIHPRVKVIAFAAALLAAGTIHHPVCLFALAAAAMLLAVLSGIPLRLFGLRLALLAAFVCATALPAIFNIITPGHTVVTLMRWGHGSHGSLAITRQGILGALTLISRVMASVSVVSLLTLTTRWSELLAALRALLVPRLFVYTLGMVYRYLSHVMETASDLFMARKSRVIRAESGAGGRQFIAAAVTGLFARSQALSEEVHRAMISRGWRGEPRTLNEWRVGRSDAAWIIASLLALAMFCAWDHFIGRF
ncbi:MAG TPA: cobalt transporter CbiM [Armatimonadota bacterium]|nr:cobalt transporter CbiM [Armatimonadota bacterium]